MRAQLSASISTTMQILDDQANVTSFDPGGGAAPTIADLQAALDTAMDPDATMSSPQALRTIGAGYAAERESWSPTIPTTPAHAPDAASRTPSGSTTSSHMARRSPIRPGLSSADHAWLQRTARLTFAMRDNDGAISRTFSFSVTAGHGPWVSCAPRSTRRSRAMVRRRWMRQGRLAITADKQQCRPHRRAAGYHDAWRHGTVDVGGLRPWRGAASSGARSQTIRSDIRSPTPACSAARRPLDLGWRGCWRARAVAGRWRGALDDRAGRPPRRGRLRTRAA